MRKSKVLSFVLVAALAVTAIPINYRNLSLMHRSIFSQLIRS